MKKALKYAGVCSLLLAAVAFVLMMATPAVVYSSGSSSVTFGGNLAIFGGALDTAQKLLLLTTGDAKPSVLALIAWILAIVGLVILLLGVLLPLLKVKAFTKFAGLLNLIAVVCLVVAGIFMFIVVPTFFAGNGFEEAPKNAAIGAGWVIGGIVYIVAGAVAICPAVADFVSKK